MATCSGVQEATDFSARCRGPCSGVHGPRHIYDLIAPPLAIQAANLSTFGHRRNRTPCTWGIIQRRDRETTAQELGDRCVGSGAIPEVSWTRAGLAIPGDATEPSKGRPRVVGRPQLCERRLDPPMVKTHQPHILLISSTRGACAKTLTAAWRL